MILTVNVQRLEQFQSGASFFISRSEKNIFLCFVIKYNVNNNEYYLTITAIVNYVTNK